MVAVAVAVYLLDRQVREEVEEVVAVVVLTGNWLHLITLEEVEVEVAEAVVVQGWI